MNEESVIAIGRAQAATHMQVYAAICMGREVREIKRGKQSVDWQKWLGVLGIDEIRAAYLIGLADLYDARAKSHTHWQCMDMFIADGVPGKLTGFEQNNLRRRKES